MTRRADRLRKRDVQMQVLAHLEAGLSVTDVMKAVSLGRQTFYRWRKEDPAFGVLCDKALDRAATNLKAKRDAYARRDAGLDFSDRVEPSDFVRWRKRYLGFDTFPHLQLMVDAIENAPPGNITMILCPPEWMKHLAVDTPIPTPDGWTTMGEVRPGDAVFAGDGSVCRVLAVTEPVMRSSYRLEFADGTSLVASDEHRWLTRTRKPQHSLSVKTTAEIFATQVAHGRPNHSIPVNGPLELPDADLPLDPYFLGYWLGDGTSASSNITTADREVLDRIRAAGYVEHRQLLTYSVRGERKWVDSPQAALRRLGVLNDKHVPAAYLRASEHQRRELLAGLMDSDGTCEPTGRCRFSGVNERLVDDVEELVRSLGIRTRRHKVTAKMNGTEIGPAYVLDFWPRVPVFHLARKLANQRLERRGDRDRWQVIRKVEPVGTQLVCCLAVDHPSRLFLAGRQFAVTHNTTLLEDYVTAAICADPNEAIAIISEGTDLARKQAARIKRRLEPDGTARDLVAHFGPFLDPTGRKPWNADYFTVLKADLDEREYTFAATGIKSALRGARWRKIILDDIQSRRTLSETKRLLGIIRDDIVTRPGQDGAIIIIGSRVGNGDVYEALLQEDGLIDTVITIPAFGTDECSLGEGVGHSNFPPQFRDDGTPLLDARGRQIGWSDEALARRAVKVGPEIWDAVYMQRPKSGAGAQVTEDELLRACDLNRRLGQSAGKPTIGGLDPALARHAAFTVCEYDAEHLYVINLVDLYQPRRNETLFAEIERLTRMHHPTLWVIESNTLQSGFLVDDRFLELQEGLGFRGIPHHTGAQKTDPTLGIPAMMNAIIRKEIVFPGASLGDIALVLLFDQLVKWRPDVPTKLLPQDAVMSLWFCYTAWRRLREQVGLDTSGWRRSGLDADLTDYPWAGTNVVVEGADAGVPEARELSYEERWAALVRG